MTLASAQRAIASDWAALARAAAGRSPRSPALAGGNATSGRCSARASYNRRYHDYDVYVHSDQPEETVSVSDATGRSASWHTDATGYADVYFRASASAAGETVSVRVGATTCQATLSP